MIIQPFKSAIPKLSHLFSQELFFESVKEQFPLYQKNGFYIKEKEAAFFIYDCQNDKRHFTGLIAGTSTADYQNGHIVKHENTLVIKEQKQERLARERQALIKPVLLTYPNSGHIEALQQDYITQFEQYYELSYKNAIHRFWKVTDPIWVSKFQEAFSKIPKAYIGDGHHRASTIAKIYQKTKNPFYNNLFSIYLPFESIKISNWNRVIAGLNGYSKLGLMAKLANFFQITPIETPYQPVIANELVMILGKQWFKMTWRKAILKKYKSLPVETQFDISIFNKEIAQGILGIGDIRTDTRIIPVEGDRSFPGLQKALRNANQESVGFVFSSLDLTDIINVAKKGSVMPPKSTFVIPRMINGMLAYPLA